MEKFGISEMIQENQNTMEKTMYTHDNIPPSVLTLEIFATELAPKLGFDVHQWVPIVQNSAAEVWWEEKNKRYRSPKKQKHTMVYEDECLKLQLMERSSTDVELFWIETNDKCKGLGSETINHILDTADELGINVIVLPVDFDTEWSGMKPIEYLRRLRNWYKSFGFKKFTPLTPELKYTHNV